MEDTIFPPTHWSVVIEAAEAEPERARRAFEKLCAEYRDAIVHWMRLQRLAPEDAEDAAHDFLEQWLRRENPLQGFQRGERHFREYLRVCLRRSLADRHERRQTARRGGGMEHVPLEPDHRSGDEAESCFQLDFALALQIHHDVLAKLKEQWQSKLPGKSFDRLQSVALGISENPGYSALAPNLSAAVGTVKSWVFRLRREYHEAFRDAVSRQTDPSSTDQDVLHLRKLLLHPPPGVTQENADPLQPPPSASRLCH